MFVLCFRLIIKGFPQTVSLDAANIFICVPCECGALLGVGGGMETRS